MTTEDLDPELMARLAEAYKEGYMRGAADWYFGGTRVEAYKEGYMRGAAERDEAYKEGYMRGAAEREWLAAANSELRSEIQELREAIKHG